MTAPREIPPEVSRRQIEASDPGASAWVAANAGSGKTYVLTLRVIKLLLRGVDPAKILCITFTKAAAANMATRVFGELAKWTALDDAQLDEAIARIGEMPGPAARARARQLFATAIETPGGLKVQTIHAFCTRLLHQFPFEADVAARFSVLDEATERQLLDQLTLKVMLDASADPQSGTGRALATIIDAAADQTVKDAINEAIDKRDEIERWLSAPGGVERALTELSRSLGITAADTAESVQDEFWSGPHLPESDWPAAMTALAAGSTNDRKHIDRLKAAMAATGRERVEAYLDVFCTTDRDPRKNVVTNALRDKYPELAQRLADEQTRACALLDKLRAVECRDRSAALLTIAHAVIWHYRREKDRRGLLDYDDLIDKTLDLFRKTSAAWVLYKLDLGIDHVLIDEAQDTSPKQWEIIGTLIGEFTAGAGARSAKRTLFAVGDDKQSIFSFQGAEPLKFSAMQTHFKRAFEEVSLEWRLVPLQTSFRSGAVLLSAVDAVFARVQAYAGLSADPVGTVHSALPDTAPGFVEIWDTLKPDEKVEREAWDAPFDTLSETSPRLRLAQKIARHVKGWIGRESVGRERRAARPGDILILVRQRGPLFEAIIRALKNEHIAVAGADRMVLTDHIAIMDLVALADALLLPQDDLALACVLKSPLFNLTEEDLFAIAWNRGERSLRDSLHDHRGTNRRIADAAARIEKLSGAARSLTPFAFYAQVLGPGEGRKHILARLGPEATDALDEFLNLALDYERRETPSLQGFVAWLRAARAEVKRDMEITRDEVRVMTVHGAKGLEAPIVILADTTSAPAGPSQRQKKLFALPASVPDAAGPLVWAARKDGDVAAVRAARENARQAAADEYRRLLYVAMTRAAERLIVCGVDGANKRPEGCWYDLIRDAIEPLAEAVADGDETVLRYRSGEPAPVLAKDEAAELVPIVTPPWLSRPVAPEPRRPVLLTPSNADDEPSPLPHAGLTDRSKAMARGTLVHRLMQSLPDIPPPMRADAARQYLARRADQFSDAERQRIHDQVLAILDNARFAPLFAPGSCAEVPIVGRLPHSKHPPYLVSGQVDRLVVTADAVLIADYKTNTPAPRSIDESPPVYIRQLAIYRAVLGLIYPGRTIRAALVWTEIPDLMEIPAGMLDDHIRTLTSA